MIIRGSGGGGSCTPDCTGTTTYLGVDETGMGSATTPNAGRWIAYQFTASAGTAECIKAAAYSVGTATTVDTGWAIYANAAGGAGTDDDLPDGTPLATHIQADYDWSSIGQGTHEFVLSECLELSAGTIYWIACYGLSDQIQLRYDNDGTPANCEVRYSSSGQSYDSPPTGSAISAGSLSDRVSAWGLTGD